jgi:hypothetical protein
MGRCRGAGDDDPRLSTRERDRDDPGGLLALLGGGLTSSKDVSERERGSGYDRPAGRGAAT